MKTIRNIIILSLFALSAARCSFLDVENYTRDMQPDVVMTDIRMPYMDGLELCSNIRQRFPATKLWYICFQGGTPNELEDEYDYEEALEFHYMYYDFVIYRIEPKTIEQQ